MLADGTRAVTGAENWEEAKENESAETDAVVEKRRCGDGRFPKLPDLLTGGKRTIFCGEEEKKKSGAAGAGALISYN